MEVEIAKLHENDLPQVVELLNEGFGSKRCCLVCPGTESLAEVNRRFQSYSRDKWELCAVAKRGANAIVGFIQCSVLGVPVWPGGFHKCKPGELYIDAIVVGEDARGLGIGTRLLSWAENTALERHCSNLTLEIIKGNRAEGLYERYGFRGTRTHDDGAIAAASTFCTNAFVCCIVGRPYGVCYAEWGYLEMIKELQSAEAGNVDD